MNRKGQNIEIDKLLRKLEASGNYSFDWNDFAPVDNKPSADNELDPLTEYNRLIFFLLEVGIFKRIHPKMEYLVFTFFGFEVINQGGWIKYLEKKIFKQNIRLIKDIALAIIPILTLIVTIFVTINHNEKKLNDYSEKLTEQNKKIENKLNIIQEGIIQIKKDKIPNDSIEKK